MSENIHQPFNTLAAHALSSYPIAEPDLAFIRHSDSVAYKVTAANGEIYLLRLHIPITAALGPHGADYTMVRSEMTWLTALNQDTDLVMQEPVRNRAGELVTRLPAEDHRMVNCTLLRWVEGVPYFRDLETEDTAYQIGTILARLHNHASRWQIPAGFKRPQRDAALFKAQLDALLPAVADRRISRPDFDQLARSVSLLAEMMSNLDTDPDHHGIMHADAHKGNMLLHEGQIRLIDFSFCAFGNYMFDVGICLGDMKPELHRHCLAGYRSLRDLPDRYEVLIEAFFLGSVVGAFSFWVANPRTWELLGKKVPQITEDFAVRFNRGERFWFTDTRA